MKTLFFTLFYLIVAVPCSFGQGTRETYDSSIPSHGIVNPNKAASDSTFTVASFNVDGLPRKLRLFGIPIRTLNPDGTESRGADLMGQKIQASNFDLVALSEDFNFHKQLLKGANNSSSKTSNPLKNKRQKEASNIMSCTHRSRVGITPRSVFRIIFRKSPLFRTDGLGLLYRSDRVDEATLEKSESWTPWKDHYGFIGNGADGLIAKGFRYYQVRLLDGTEFDLYCLHMDAGNSPGDQQARASQLQQLAQAILTTNHCRPILIMGDTNCRYTRDPILRLLFDPINADPRFTISDPWVELTREGRYPTTRAGSLMTSRLGPARGEVVDKIWYVNHTDSPVQLSPVNYHLDLTFNAPEDLPATSTRAGQSLSDHRPCVVTFRYSKQASGLANAK